MRVPVLNVFYQNAALFDKRHTLCGVYSFKKFDITNPQFQKLTLWCFVNYVLFRQFKKKVPTQQQCEIEGDEVMDLTWEGFLLKSNHQSPYRKASWRSSCFSIKIRTNPHIIVPGAGLPVKSSVKFQLDQPMLLLFSNFFLKKGKGLQTLKLVGSILTNLIIGIKFPQKLLTLSPSGDDVLPTNLNPENRTLYPELLLRDVIAPLAVAYRIKYSQLNRKLRKIVKNKFRYQKRYEWIHPQSRLSFVTYVIKRCAALQSHRTFNARISYLITNCVRFKEKSLIYTVLDQHQRTAVSMLSQKNRKTV